MAFDGLTTACLVKELQMYLTDARISKIVQTEKDELILTCKTAQETERGRTVRLLLCARAQLPLCALIRENRAAPKTAPAFCMLLRKHLENGRILQVTQPSLERVIRILVSHYDEIGDLKTYTLLIELMGKHSNIILIDDKDMILDAIRHIPASVSSVREVLPGRDYFLPNTMNKRDPLLINDVVTLTAVLEGKDEDDAAERKGRAGSRDVREALVNRLTGISPVLAMELCALKGVDYAKPLSALSYEERKALTEGIISLSERVREGQFSPCIYYEKYKELEYAAIPLTVYESMMSGQNMRKESFAEMSDLLTVFYARKSDQARIKNKSASLRQQVSTILARTVRKYDYQMQQLKDTESRDRYRLRGELLTAYAHEIAPGAKEARLTDYNTGKEVTIPLDAQLSATENAQKNFDRYARMKRTYQTLSVLTREVAEEIEHLKSIRMSLDLATDERELAEIRRELADSGYLKEKRRDKENTEKSSPYHYLTSDGYDVYVGKNNTQNDQLTFHLQGKDDWWFHAKGVPGSHVVLCGKGAEIPDRAFEEAASLAAFYSAARNAGKAEVDYTERRNVKKPAKAKPGFVVYYTNYSLVADTDISALKPVSGGPEGENA